MESDEENQEEVLFLQSDEEFSSAHETDDVRQHNTVEELKDSQNLEDSILPVEEKVREESFEKENDDPEEEEEEEEQLKEEHETQLYSSSFNQNNRSANYPAVIQDYLARTENAEEEEEVEEAEEGTGIGIGGSLHHHHPHLHHHLHHHPHLHHQLHHHLADDDDESVLIANTNKILTSLGIAAKQIFSMEELKRVAPSMFVAVVEALFKMRIDGIIRNPQTKKDYIQNAQVMIDCLSEVMKLDLSYITGEMIWEGNHEALSNLVSIFLRLLSLTGPNESLPSLGSNEQNGEEEEFHRRFSYPSGDSISTKGSLLLPKHSSSLPHQKRNHPRRRHSYYYEDPVRMIYHANKQHAIPSQAERQFTQKFLKESFRKSEKFLQSDLKQYHANQRRKVATNYQKNLLLYRNQQKTNQAKKALQEKWKKDFHLEQKSFELKAQNAETLALHKIYEALFRELARRRAEEKREEHQQVLQLKRRLENEVDSLDRLYRERIQMVEQQDEYRRNFSRAAYEDVLNEVSINLQTQLDRKNNLIKQQRDREILWKKEACDQLLLSTHGAKWEDYLRTYPVSNINRDSPTISPNRYQRKKKVRTAFY